MFVKSKFLTITVIALISFVSPAIGRPGSAKASTGRPNILFILADDLGYGDLGSYGQAIIKTPRLDRMAQEGLRFTRCYAGGPKCATSRASLLTGKHSGHLDIRGNQSSHPDYEWMPLHQKETSVLKVLHDAGYTTGMIGKWGMVEVDHGPESEGNPNKHGVDHFYGAMDHMHANVAYPGFLWRNGKREYIPQNKNASKNDDRYSHDLYTREALKFIRENKSNEFFLYLAYSIPHANSYYTGTDQENDPRRMHIPSDEPYSDREWPQQERNFAAMITRMDRDVGTMLDLLDELGLSENTIVIFTSDNGPHKQANHDYEFFNSNGDLKGLKGDLYEGGIRVPMIVRQPGTIQAGQVSEQVLTFWDFLPTAAAIAGVTPPSGIDGQSFLPMLRGKPPKETKPLFWEHHSKYSKEVGFAVRDGEWKGIMNGSGNPLELYNLSSDPSEENNLAASHPEMVRRLNHLIRTSRTPSIYWPTPSD